MYLSNLPSTLCHRGTPIYRWDCHLEHIISPSKIVNLQDFVDGCPLFVSFPHVGSHERQIVTNHRYMMYSDSDCEQEPTSCYLDIKGKQVKKEKGSLYFPPGWIGVPRACRLTHTILIQPPPKQSLFCIQWQWNNHFSVPRPPTKYPHILIKLPPSKHCLHYSPLSALMELLITDTSKEADQELKHSQWNHWDSRGHVSDRIHPGLGDILSVPLHYDCYTGSTDAR